MDEIHCTHIKRGWNSNAASITDEPVNKVEIDLAMVEAAVDVGTGDIEKSRRTDRSGKSQQDVHRKSGRRPAPAFNKLFVELREIHEFSISLRGLGQSEGRPTAAGRGNPLIPSVRKSAVEQWLNGNCAALHVPRPVVELGVKKEPHSLLVCRS